MTRRLLVAAAVAAAVLGPTVPASADPICDLEHCILPRLCERVGGCDVPSVVCVDLVVRVVCP